MSSFLDGLLRVLTLGLYGRGSSRKEIKRYRKDGKLKVHKDIERDGTGIISNAPDIINGNHLKDNYYETQK